MKENLPADSLTPTAAAATRPSLPWELLQTIPTYLLRWDAAMVVVVVDARRSAWRARRGNSCGPRA